jgi:Tfp pilus assembly protein PilW
VVSRFHQPARRFSARGLSLPEAMISLVITSLLLLAVASAFSASCTVIEGNDNFFRSTQSARVTLQQIIIEIRNCDSLQMSPTDTTTLSIIRPAYAANSGQILYRQVGPPAEVSRAFVYSATNQNITLTITYADGSTQGPFELASNVTACTFGPPDMGVDYNGASIPIRVPITITISTHGSTVVLNGSAAPRRAMKY